MFSAFLLTVEIQQFNNTNFLISSIVWPSVLWNAIFWNDDFINLQEIIKAIKWWISDNCDKI